MHTAVTNAFDVLMTARIKVLITIRRHQNMLTGPPGRVCPSVTSVDSGAESMRRKEGGNDVGKRGETAQTERQV